MRGEQIVMRGYDGEPVMFEDVETGQTYQGYDPSDKDRWGNQVGEPTGQTHAAAFFDYDDDRDPDLWVADDGNRLHVYRNDSTPGNPAFTPVAAEMGLDAVGAWMGFAFGDYDGDSDLDVFVTNMGYHLVLRPPKEEISGTCEYHIQFAWANCFLYLLRNDGIRDDPTIGRVGVFTDVAPSVEVTPSPDMPPRSLDPSLVHSSFDPRRDWPPTTSGLERLSSTTITTATRTSTGWDPPAGVEEVPVGRYFLPQDACWKASATVRSETSR